MRPPAWLDSPEGLTSLCACLENGGTMMAWCAAVNIAYPEVYRWVQASPERVARVKACVTPGQAWSAQRIIEELRALALLDLRRAYDARGALLPIQDIPPDVAAAIVSIESVELTDRDGAVTGTVRRVKFADKLRALELHGKHLQMFRELHEIVGKLTLEDLLTMSHQAERDRAATPAPERFQN